MAYILSGGLLIVNLIYSFGYKHKKALAFLLMTCAWLLFWGNTNNPDYYAYSTIYKSNTEFSTNNLEIGFKCLVKLGNVIGLSYEVFLIFLSLACYVLIHSTVKKYSNNFNCIYFLYFIFPFFFDVVQIRNFIVMSILIYSTRYLLNNSKLKYCLLITIAGTFHIIAFAYLPFIFTNAKKKMVLVRVIVSLSIIGSILILLNNKEVYLLKNLSTYINNDKLYSYVSTTTNYGFLLYWSLQTLSYLMICITKKFYKKYNDNASQNYIKNRYLHLVYWINVITFMYFPLYIFNSNFSRLMRNIIPLNYIAFAITSGIIREKNEKTIYVILIILYVCIFFVALLLPYKDTIIKTILENNLILYSYISVLK